MPRTMRVEYPGAIYHVMDRGDRREDIFVDDVDRQDFLKTLAEAWQKTGWQVQAHPDKLAIALRLRNETTLSSKWIAARVRIGSSKGAKSMLPRWVHRQENTRAGQARAGRAGAQLEFESTVFLGTCYAKGQGVEKNVVEAYKWSLLASEQGCEGAKEDVAALETGMTPDQIAEGKKLARSCEFRQMPVSNE